MYPSRRSGERLDECFTSGNLFSDTNTLYYLSTAFVGFEAAVAFKDFVESMDKQVTVKDILVKGDFSKLRDFDINDYAALVGKIESELSETDSEGKKVMKRIPLEQSSNALKFMMNGMPSELVMKMWAIYGTNEDNLMDLHDAVCDGRTLSDLLVHMLEDK